MKNHKKVSMEKKISVIYRIIVVGIVFLLLGALGVQIFGKRNYEKDTSINTKPKLQFSENGTFKIMILADIQDGANVSSYTMKFIAAAIEKETPDLIVLLGDNVFGIAPDLILSKSGVEKSIETFLQPILAAETPFCLVFGNHDGQGIMSNEEQLTYYQTFAGCLLEDEPNLTGSGNCHLMVFDQKGETPELNLWFFDSGSETEIQGETSYTCVAEDQIAWYLDKSKEIKEDNKGEIVPAFVFQHIPVPEIYNLLLPVEESCEGSVEKEGKIYVKNSACTDDGFFGELPCSPIYNTGEFDAWVQSKDVVAAFFGHDHVNAFGGTYQGIQMIYTPGCGFYSYGPGYDRGIRILEIEENKVEAFTTRLLYYKDLVGEEINDKGALYEGSVLRGKSLFKYIQLFVLIPFIFLGVIVWGVVHFIRKRKTKKDY
jgi:hypothetical protein